MNNTENAPLRAHDMAPARRGRPAGSVNKPKNSGAPRASAPTKEGQTAEKSKGLDFAAVLGGVSELDTEQIVRLPIGDLIPDPENFYSLDGLEELATSIENIGLLDAIRVRPFEGKYMIVSGHRRKAACQLLRDGGDERFETVPCIVEYGEASAAMRKLRLIFANANTRQLSSSELSRQAEEVQRLLYELQAQGVEFKGRMREHVAQACGVTKSKIARLHAIRHGLHPDILKLYDAGKLSESAAYELSKLPQAVQDYLSRRKKLADGVQGTDAAECVKRCESYLHPGCKCPDGTACTHTYPRFYQTLVPGWGFCRGECCLDCRYTESDCPYQCTQAKKKTEARREKDRREREKAEKERQKREEINRGILAKQYAQLAALCDAAGLKGDKIINIPGAYTVADCKAKAENPALINGYDCREARVFDKYSYAGRVSDFAELVGVSVDYLLGRTDTPTVSTGEEKGERIATAACALPRNDTTAPEARWLSGTPEAEGWYACLGVWADIPERMIVFWRDGDWYEEKNGRRKLSDTKIHSFYPLPDLEEANDD